MLIDKFTSSFTTIVLFTWVVLEIIVYLCCISYKLRYILTISDTR